MGAVVPAAHHCAGGGRPESPLQLGPQVPAFAYLRYYIKFPSLKTEENEKLNYTN